ncbi:MAG: carbohydrate kinase family protein [Bacteroidales bacterium]|nr:carbohydrate kinase family protein [Bacteroidales bacterium]
MKQIKVVKNALGKLINNHESKLFLIGFDGFVDEIIHVVSKRLNDDTFERIETITDFSDRVAGCAGLSANIELVPLKAKLGGNGPIMANAVMAQNNNVIYIGALGKHYIHPIFREFADNCQEVISITEPGHTDALEFFDGKIMLGKMNNLTEVNWAHVLSLKPATDLAKTLKFVDMIAFTNWTMLSNMNSIIEGFNELLKKINHKPYAFFDLADPQKRTKGDIAGVLKLISKIHCHSILSMNESESLIISNILALNSVDSIQERAELIHKELNISAIVIHPVNGAAVSHKNGSAWINGPYTSKPKLTTGAGDNFNAGFCNAWLSGLEPDECLSAGVCTSGFYVRNTYSPSLNELTDFMDFWQKNNCGEI